MITNYKIRHDNEQQCTRYISSDQHKCFKNCVATAFYFYHLLLLKFHLLVTGLNSNSLEAIIHYRSR